MSEPADLVPVEIVSDEPTSIPKWKRMIFLNPQTKEVYIPAAASPAGEFWAWLAAGHDGQPGVRFRNHPYILLAWMRQEYPEWRDVYDAIQGNADRAFQGIAEGTL